jgi:GcrA cell cycle regulator
MDGTQKTWTTERIALLKNRIEAGFSRGQIAREMGMSRNAVIGKANRLGLFGVRGPVQQLDPSAKIARPRKVTQRRILQALRANLQLAFTEVVGDCANRCSLLELQQWHCRWPTATRGRKVSASAGTIRSKAFHIAQRMPVWRIDRAPANGPAPRLHICAQCC